MSDAFKISHIALPPSDSLNSSESWRKRNTACCANYLICSDNQFSKVSLSQKLIHLMSELQNAINCSGSAELVTLLKFRESFQIKLESIGVGVATNQQKTAGISILTGSQFTPDLKHFLF